MHFRLHGLNRLYNFIYLSFLICNTCWTLEMICCCSLTFWSWFLRSINTVSLSRFGSELKFLLLQIHTYISNILFKNNKFLVQRNTNRITTISLSLNFIFQNIRTNAENSKWVLILYFNFTWIFLCLQFVLWCGCYDSQRTIIVTGVGPTAGWGSFLLYSQFKHETDISYMHVH